MNVGKTLGSQDMSTRMSAGNLLLVWDYIAPLQEADPRQMESPAPLLSLAI